MTRGPDIEVSIPEQLNLTTYFLEENISKGRGDKTAIYFKDEKHTFNDVCTLTNKIGNVLKEIGVKIEDRVLLILQDSPEWVASWYATMKIGGVSTHAYTYLLPGGYEDFVNLVRPEVIVVDDTTLDKVREGIKRTRHSPALLLAGDAPAKLGVREYNLSKMLESASMKLDAEPTSRDDIAFWNFSGGTTGKPKGVPHMHRDGLVGCESWQNVVKYNEDDIILNVPKMFFHYAHDVGMNFPIRAGAAVVLFPERTTAGLIYKLAHKHNVSVLINVPTMMRAMLQTPESERTDLSSLRMCTSAGEALSTQLHVDWIKTFGGDVIDNIGSAESYGAYLVRYPGAETPPGSVGKVCPLFETRIVDKKGNEIPKGEIGVLHVHTDAAGQCYVREHEKTKNTFIGNDWINTNDLFREDENGFFWYCGRADDLVKISGVWVSPLEIETCLQTHPSVKECAVLGIEDSDGLTKGVAFVALVESCEPSDEIAGELKTYCKENLAPYKSPKVMKFMNELPKTGYNKIDKRQLREQGL